MADHEIITKTYCSCRQIPYWTSVKDFDTVPRDSLLHKLENMMALGDHCSTCSDLFSVKWTSHIKDVVNGETSRDEAVLSGSPDLSFDDNVLIMNSVHTFICGTKRLDY